MRKLRNEKTMSDSDPNVAGGKSGSRGKVAPRGVRKPTVAERIGLSGR